MNILYWIVKDVIFSYFGVFVVVCCSFLGVQSCCFINMYGKTFCSLLGEFFGRIFWGLLGSLPGAYGVRLWATQDLQPFKGVSKTMPVGQLLFFFSTSKKTCVTFESDCVCHFYIVDSLSQSPSPSFVKCLLNNQIDPCKILTISFL